MAEMYGVYRGEVVRTDDPEQRGRLLLRVPQVLGSALSPWAEPSQAQVQVPSVGSAVWVLFVGGDVTKAVYLATPPLPAPSESLLDENGDLLLSNDLTVAGTTTLVGDTFVHGALVIGSKPVTGAWIDMSTDLTFTGFTKGNGTVDASYAWLTDHSVSFRVHITFGSTSTYTGIFLIAGLPFSALTEQAGSAILKDLSVPARYPGVASLLGDSIVRIYHSTSAAATNLSPFTWATGDEIIVSGVVEVST